jgi:WD40 repeat protein
MKLSRESYRQLHSALLDAFPKQANLEMVVRYHLELNPAEIEGTNLKDFVFNLIAWAESQDRVDELLAGARAENPGNQKLQEVQLLRQPDPKPLPIPDPLLPKRRWPVLLGGAVGLVLLSLGLVFWMLGRNDEPATPRSPTPAYTSSPARSIIPPTEAIAPTTVPVLPESSAGATASPSLPVPATPTELIFPATANKVALLQQLEGPGGAATGLAFSSDGTLLAVGYQNGSVDIWSLAERSVVRTLSPHTGKIVRVAFGPSDKYLATAGADGIIRVWRVSDGSEQRDLVVYGDQVNSLTFSPAGEIVASAGSKDGTAWLLPGTNGVSFPAHQAALRSGAVAPDRDVLATASEDHTVRLWQLPSRELIRTLEGHTGPVVAVAFAPNGKLLASGSTDQTMRLWQVGDGSLVGPPAQHSGDVGSIVFSPVARVLATGTSDGKIWFWDTGDVSLRRTLPAHSKYINALAFSPFGRVLASASDDGTVKLWGIPQAP